MWQMLSAAAFIPGTSHSSPVDFQLSAPASLCLRAAAQRPHCPRSAHGFRRIRIPASPSRRPHPTVYKIPHPAPLPSDEIILTLCFASFSKVSLENSALGTHSRNWFESSSFIRWFFFLVSLLHFSTIVLYTSQINNLYLEPCLGVYFWRIQTKSQLYVLLFITFPRISRLTPWRPCFRNSKVLYIKGIVLKLKIALQDR